MESWEINRREAVLKTFRELLGKWDYKRQSCGGYEWDAFQEFVLLELAELYADLDATYGLMTTKTSHT